MTARNAIFAGAIAAALAATAGVAFAMWVDKGPSMLMAMVEAGLAWCF